jgi:hypothetical protein
LTVRPPDAEEVALLHSLFIEPSKTAAAGTRGDFILTEAQF